MSLPLDHGATPGVLAAEHDDPNFCFICCNLFQSMCSSPGLHAGGGGGGVGNDRGAPLNTTDVRDCHVGGVGLVLSLSSGDLDRSLAGSSLMSPRWDRRGRALNAIAPRQVRKRRAGASWSTVWIVFQAHLQAPQYLA